MKKFNEKMPVKIERMTPARTAKLNLRLKDRYFADNWERALDIVPSIDWMNGKGNRGWKANFEYFMRPESVLKIIENNKAYNNLSDLEKYITRD